MIISEINKNMTEKIIVAIQKFKGSTFCDIRVYVLVRNGQWVPTKKGITFNKENIDDIREFLKEASRELKKGKPAESDGEHK